MGFWLIPEKVARNGPLRAVYGHYMGLNFGVFWQTDQLKHVFSMRTKKERFTGVFFGCYRGKAYAIPVYAIIDRFPLVREHRSAVRRLFSFFLE